MKSYQWWKKQKKRVQKKYTLCLGRYLSPKELKIMWKKHGVRSITAVLDAPTIIKVDKAESEE